jgi:hypothetical protein
VGAVEFGRLVDAARNERDWSYGRLGYEIGVLPTGKVLNEAQVGRILEGRRRLTPWLVERLVAVFEWDEEQEAAAWFAAGLAPEDATLDDYRRLVAGRRRERREDRRLKVASAEPAAVLRTGDVEPRSSTEVAQAA